MRIDHRKVHHKIKTLDRVRTYVYAGLACLVLLVILAKIQIETTSYAFAGNSPVGYFDLISPDGTLYGWSFDPSHSSVSNTVTISMDSPSNRVAQVAANLSRPDVNRVMGVVGNHGFSWKIPAQ